MESGLLVSLSRGFVSATIPQGWIFVGFGYSLGLEIRWVWIFVGFGDSSGLFPSALVPVSIGAEPCAGELALPSEHYRCAQRLQRARRLTRNTAERATQATE